MFDAIADFGVTRRGLDEKAWALQCWNPREFAVNAYKTIDDRPYGGGPGMVMMAEPLNAALDAAVAAQVAHANVNRGDKKISVHFAKGLDEKTVHLKCLTQSFDYVLSGGELAAMVIIDAMVRLLPGVLGDGQSAVEDSFSPSRNGLLDHPHYTRPESWSGETVPPVLMSGDHAKIEVWRRKEALKRTQQRRPDLLTGKSWSKQDLKLLDEIRREQKSSNSSKEEK
ncbi:MAG: tRNA (guanosine(37)-N1)-methyltransferase TrmD [Usitatibacteraceae bacterium]